MGVRPFVLVDRNKIEFGGTLGQEAAGTNHHRLIQHRKRTLVTEPFLPEGGWKFVNRETTLSSITLTKDGRGEGRIRKETRNVPLELTAVQEKRSPGFDDARARARIEGSSYDKMGRLTEGGGRSLE